MSNSPIQYHPAVPISENDDVPGPSTKRVLVYGWDAVGLQKVRLSTNANGELTAASRLDGYEVCFVDESGTTTYVSMENSAAKWIIMKIDTGVFTYASVKNNPTYTAVTTARGDRATLTYQLPNLGL